jgi:hypothetical protein
VEMRRVEDTERRGSAAKSSSRNGIHFFPFDLFHVRPSTLTPILVTLAILDPFFRYSFV